MRGDFNGIRSEFSALEQKPYGQPLVYLDSAATALKPDIVVDKMMQFYRNEASNVHRGAHYLSDRATEKFEASRIKVRDFIGAKDEREIIFTGGTTDSINLVAQTFGRQNLSSGDEIILTEMEHHSNIVPWQILAQEKGLILRWAPVNHKGELILEEYKKLFNEKTKLVSLVHCSNTLGTVNPVREWIQLAHQYGAKILIDAAQSVTFQEINVQQMDCDFLAFSGHKLYGPFGVGVLYGKLDLLQSLQPWRGGGAMIASVTKEKTLYLESPQRFEAGTPNISGVVGLSAAIDYVQALGFDKINRHACDLLNDTIEKLNSISGIRYIGTSSTRVNIVSFIIEGLHPADVGQILDRQGVAVRVGHHCTQPLMARYGIPGTIRASYGVYNTEEDVEILVRALKKVREILI